MLARTCGAPATSSAIVSTWNQPEWPGGSNRIHEEPDARGRRHERCAPHVIPVGHGQPRRLVYVPGGRQHGRRASADGAAGQFAGAVHQCPGQVAEALHLLAGHLHRGAIGTRTTVAAPPGRPRASPGAHPARPQNRRQAARRAAKPASSAAKNSSSPGNTARTSMRASSAKPDCQRSPVSEPVRRHGGALEPRPEVAYLAYFVALRIPSAVSALSKCARRRTTASCSAA